MLNLNSHIEDCIAQTMYKKFQLKRRKIQAFNSKINLFWFYIHQHVGMFCYIAISRSS